MKPTISNKTIAVLPFVNMSSSEENEYFSDGITEEIINALAKIKALKVTSRTSSFFFKDKQIPITEIGQQLNVSTILEGSVRLAGNMMRITAQLIDVKEDFHFWSETFDRSLDNIFAVQDEISLLIADRLREHVGHIEIEDSLVESSDVPVKIYQRYLEGRYHLMKLDLAGTEKGITIFEEVIAQAPDFVLPYLGANQGYAYLGTMGQKSPAEAFAKAQPFLEKAIEIGQDLPEVQLNLAWSEWWQNWNLENGYKHILKSIDLRPSDQAYLTLSNFFSLEGKFKAAHTYIDQAVQLDPLNPMNHHMKGFIYYLEENYTAALPYFEKSLSLQPDLDFPRLYKGQNLILMRQQAEAISYLESFPENNPLDASRLGGETLIAANQGEIEQAKQGIEQLRNMVETHSIGNAINYLIYCLAAIDQKEEAIDLIEEGIKQHLSSFFLFYTEPLLKSLRPHPRFQALMKKMFGERTSFDLPVSKYKKSLFTADSLSQSKQQLENLMQNEKPYLDPGLSLRSLAGMLALPPNHLSQLLNEGFDKNFAEFVNTYRLEDFKYRVNDSSNKHLTILALAYESGFNSKTVFNTFFKKMEGMTPRAYWKRIGE